MLKQLIKDNYGIEIENLKLIDKHFGVEIFLAETFNQKYVVKTFPLYVENLENEGYITDYLYKNHINVARLLKSDTGKYVVKTDTSQFHLQEFIEGETININSAPDWFLDKSAQVLGKIHSVLQDYRELPIMFGEDFLNNSTVANSKQFYTSELCQAQEKKDDTLIFELKEQLKHLDRISTFNFEANKFTYSNSHGDFYIGQIISSNNNLTIIDWTSACRLPICLEVIMSYAYADPMCKNGTISTDKFKKYLCHYQKYFSLNQYDIKMLPYLFYYQLCICNYTPPYSDIPDAYKPISNLIINLMNWLYDNVERLSIEICK